MQSDLDASKTRMEVLEVTADEHTELSSHVVTLQEQIAAESAASAAHEARCSSLSTELSEAQTELANVQVAVESEMSQSRKDLDGHQVRCTELETELQTAQSAAQQLEAEKHAVVADHASALEALRQEHTSVVAGHASTREQMQSDLDASKTRMEVLEVTADEHTALSSHVVTLQEQIAAESAASAAHEASCHQLQKELDDNRAAVDAVQAVATASALETSELSDKIASLQEELAIERQAAGEHQTRSSDLSIEVAKVQEDLAKAAREQEMATEHHRVKLAALERTHSEAVSTLVVEHEENLSVELETQALELQNEVSIARDAAEHASETEQAVSLRAEKAEEESRQQAAEVGRLLKELEATRAECLALKAAADVANASREKTDAALAAKDEEHKKLLVASKVAAEEGAALESTMSTLSERVSTDSALRAAAEQEAAESSAALQEAQGEVAELKAQAELVAVGHAELVEEHKLALGAAELDVEEAERANVEAQAMLETVQTEYAAAVEAGASHESTASELQQQLESAESARLAAEEQAEAHMERATSAEQVRNQSVPSIVLLLFRLNQNIALASPDSCTPCVGSPRAASADGFDPVRAPRGASKGILAGRKLCGGSYRRGAGSRGSYGRSIEKRDGRDGA
jgi:chromosome segregation ATPase